jgi:hypothetical protein
MFVVEYGYYNYPRKIKTFTDHAAAKIFFYSIVKQNAVKRAELKEIV